MTEGEIARIHRLLNSGGSEWDKRRDEFFYRVGNGIEIALKQNSARINLNSTDSQNVRRDPRTEALLDWVQRHQQEFAVKSARIPTGNPTSGSNAVCLSIRLSSTWEKASACIVETAKRILQEVKTKSSPVSTVRQTAGGGSVNAAPTSVREPVSTQKTSKKSGKGAKADTLDWSDVSFCDKKVITHKDVVDILVDGKNANEKIFPGSMRDIFLQRYKKMQENFMESLSEEVWRQGGNAENSWGDGLSLANPESYKDALLRIDERCFSKKDEFWVGADGLLKYPCVGHDLPVWLSPKTKTVEGKGKRIMIVSQDPLRKGHGPGALYLSTPWGLHSKAYRSGKLLYKQLLRLLKAGATIYLTDWWKLYNKPEKKRKSVRTSLKKPYENSFTQECNRFSPDLIITFGKPASVCINPNLKETFQESVMPDNYSGDSTFPRGAKDGDPEIKIPVLSFLHPNAQCLKGDGAKTAYCEWAQQKILETLK